MRREFLANQHGKLKIKKFYISHFHRKAGIIVGFCDKQFPLEVDWPKKDDEWLGLWKNTIGIWRKGSIGIDGNLYCFDENCKAYFKKWTVVGLGIIHQSNGKMKCFATWKGKLLGKMAKNNKKSKNFQLLRNG